MKKKKIKFLVFLFLVSILFLVFYFLNYFSILPKRSYTNFDFGIETYHSLVDFDQDGLDDQMDILLSAKEYIKTKPKYKSKYYETGYPNDNYGVCTDVVAFALLGAGYDLQELVDLDIRENRDLYNISVVDKNIDFRRVKNLKIYFSHHAISLTKDTKDIASFQGGDIVIFKNHIGILSDKRNKQGLPYLIHNAGQPILEEDVLERYEIVGHFRIS